MGLTQHGSSCFDTPLASFQLVLGARLFGGVLGRFPIYLQSKPIQGYLTQGVQPTFRRKTICGPTRVSPYTICPGPLVKTPVGHRAQPGETGVLGKTLSQLV